MLSEEKIIEMVLDIVSIVDYDIYKSKYLLEYSKNPEEACPAIQRLVTIVKKYLEENE